jgi:N4-gp56 family major capsid protein
MSANTTSTLTQEAQTFYEKKFLARAEYESVFEQGAQMRTQPKNGGDTVKFTRHTPLATVTTALTQGTNPSEVALTASNVSAQLAEYGTAVKISRFLTLNGIDVANAEKIEVVGQNMRETLDELVRNELFTGATVQFQSAKTALSALSASDVLKVKDIQLAVRTLKRNKARRLTSNVAPWMGKLSPDTSYDLQQDSTWINADTYSNGATQMYRGELGKIAGARLMESANQKHEAGGATEVYSTFFHGDQAFGSIDLEGDAAQLYIIPHTKIDSNNPAGRFSMVSWATSYVAKTLNANWLINVKVGITA